MKRTIDIIFSVIGLIVLSPVFILISLLIYLDSKGKIIYISKRTGKNRKNFNIYKFRTMYPNSDHMSITVGNRDPRVTNVGYYLRKYKLDELPQLFNVLKGDMSIVGPRPDVPYFDEYYIKHLPEYYRMKPGITSYSSIYFSDEDELYKDSEDPINDYICNTIPKKVELDKKYLKESGVITDLSIIFKTLKKFFKADPI